MGDALEYVSAYPIASFADYEAHPFPAEQALGKEAWATLRGKLVHCATSLHRYANLQLEDDPRIETATREPAPYAMVTFMHAVPGKGPELLAWLKNDYFPVMKKAEVKNMFISRTAFGGPSEYVVFRAMDDLGEIDAASPITKVLGAEGARNLMAKTAGVVGSIEYRIYRYRSDLSYQNPPSQTTASAR